MKSRTSLVGLVVLAALLPGLSSAGILNQQISVSAELLKPYTEIEYNGTVYALENLRGGHNGVVAMACQTNPPVFNPATGRWVVPVINSLIHFEGEATPFGHITLGSINNTANGYLDVLNSSATSTPDDLGFPVDSVFTFRVRLELLDLGVTLFSRDTITVEATNLSSWPPAVGTIYTQNDYVDLIAVEGGPTIATLRPDTTIVTAVQIVPEPSSMALMCVGILLAIPVSLLRSCLKNLRFQDLSRNQHLTTADPD